MFSSGAVPLYLIWGLQGQDHEADYEALRAHLESVINEGGGSLVVTSIYVVQRSGYNHVVNEIYRKSGPRGMWDDEPVDYLPNKTLIVTYDKEDCHDKEESTFGMEIRAREEFNREGWDNHFKKVKDAEGGCCLLM